MPLFIWMVLFCLIMVSPTSSTRAGTPPGFHFQRADSLLRVQEYSDAFALVVGRLADVRDNSPSDTLSALSLLNKAAAISYEANDRFAAGLALDTALPLARKLGARGAPELARALVFKGLLNRRYSRFDAAAEELNEAQSLLNRLPEDPRLLGRLKQAKANLHRSLYGSASSWKLYEEALDYRKSHLTRPDIDIADNLVWLAWNLNEAGKVDRARGVLDEAEKELGDLGCSGHTLMNTILEMRFDWAAMAGDITACKRLANREVAIFERARKGFPFGYARGSACPPNCYRQLLWVQLQEQDFSEAFQTWELGLAPVTREFFRLNHWLASGGRDSGEALRLLYGQLRCSLDILGNPDLTPGDRLVTVTSALRNWSAIQNLIRIHMDDWDRGKVTIGDVQEQLRPGTALVGFSEFRIGGKNFLRRTIRRHDRWLVVIRPSGPARWVRAQAASGPELEASLQEDTHIYRTLERALDWPTRLLPDPDLDERLARQAEGTLGPILPLLKGVDTVLSVGSALSLVFAYCPGAPQNAATLPDTEIFVELSRRSARNQPNPDVLVVGAADGITGPPLNNAATELEFLKSLFPGATVLDGEKASEGQIEDLSRAGLLKKFGLIHFACHAWNGFSPQRTALVLNDYHGSGSGLLDAGELLYFYDFQPDLVVLSGCSTARGRGIIWNDFYSLAQVFLSRGASSVVASRWNVDDRATELIMKRFYRNLFMYSSEKGNGGRDFGTMSRAAALAEAARWLRDYRDADGHRPFGHPIYWSGFLIYGLP